MACIPYEHFLEHLKDYFIEMKYTNVKVNIFERDGPPAEEEERTLYKTVHAHAIILDMHSPYFEKCLVEQKQVPSVLEVLVEKGKGKYLDIIISAFYDRNVLVNLSLDELFAVLELGVIYSNEEFVKNILEIINETEQEQEFNTAYLILNKIYSFMGNDTLNGELISELKKANSEFLCNYFSPIEEKREKHDDFCSLQYPVLLYMLQSLEPIAMSENSLLTFIIIWLEHDILRQKGEVIEGLLTSLHVKYLNGVFLHSCITVDHVTLNKWNGYKNWFVDCLGFHLMTDKEQSDNFPAIHNQVSRSTVNGIHNWYIDKGKTPSIVRWMVHMTPEEMNKKFGPTTHYLVHDGLKFNIESITISPLENSDSGIDSDNNSGSVVHGDSDSDSDSDSDRPQFNLTLSLSCPRAMRSSLHLFLGILPADRSYDTTKIVFFSRFAQSFIKYFGHNADLNKISKTWRASQDLIDVGNNNGFLVFLLPLTKDEYDKLSAKSILHRCHNDVSNVSYLKKCGSCNNFCCRVREQIIELRKASDFSV